MSDQVQAQQPDAEQGKYVYCIIRTDSPKDFGSVGIGGRGDKVYTIPYNEFAAVVSNCPLIVFDPTRENALAHEHVRALYRCTAFADRGRQSGAVSWCVVRRKPRAAAPAHGFVGWPSGCPTALATSFARHRGRVRVRGRPRDTTPCVGDAPFSSFWPHLLR